MREVCSGTQNTGANVARDEQENRGEGLVIKHQRTRLGEGSWIPVLISCFQRSQFILGVLECCPTHFLQHLPRGTNRHRCLNSIRTMDSDCSSRTKTGSFQQRNLIAQLSQTVPTPNYLNSPEAGPLSLHLFLQVSLISQQGALPTSL